MVLPRSESVSLLPSSMAVKCGLCLTWSEQPKTGFSLDAAQIRSEAS